MRYRCALAARVRSGAVGHRSPWRNGQEAPRAAQGAQNGRPWRACRRHVVKGCRTGSQGAPSHALGPPWSFGQGESGARRAQGVTLANWTSGHSARRQRSRPFGQGRARGSPGQGMERTREPVGLSVHVPAKAGPWTGRGEPRTPGGAPRARQGGITR